MFEIDKYNREVYGESEFEPVVLDILNSQAMQRLKGIQQHGSDAWVWKNISMTRFEHSLGVFLLLRKLGAPLEEKIAGLLHDVAHCAFSHVVDFVFNIQLSADFHETEADGFLEKSDLPEILEKHGYSFSRIMHHENFPLLEKSAPDLCADRIDYFLRDASHAGILTMDQVKFLLSSLIVKDNEVVFNSKKAALLFSEKYLETNRKIYASPGAIFFHTMLAEALRIALDKKIVSRDDLFTTDDEVKEKLVSSGNPDILNKLNLISEKTKLVPTEKDDCDLHLKVKVRIVDPKILIDGKLERLSEIDGKYRKILEESRSLQKIGHFIKVSV
jgi:uncharacterized protein